MHINKRKENIFEQELLLEIHNTLKEDISRITRMVNANSKMKKSCEVLIKHIEADTIEIFKCL